MNLETNVTNKKGLKIYREMVKEYNLKAQYTETKIDSKNINIVIKFDNPSLYEKFVEDAISRGIHFDGQSS